SSVGAKTPTALRDIPQSVTVINKALMESQGLTSFQDALRNAPGITIGGAEGGQIGNNINLRGFTAQNDIYLDGFRDRNQYYRDTFDLDSVEVLYGPSSMLFGRGSTGGVINQVSKKANLKPSAEVSTTIGT
ncbi:TonB-dependent receptor plug domain-containing protein, partial [Burkholderia sp. SIMBA_042]